MIAVLDFVILTSAFVFAAGVIAVMVAPQWQRILRLASGHVEPAFAPLTQLAAAERRILVRRRAVVGAPVSRLREAA